MKKSIRIALTGGGSGGHIYPLLAVVERLKKISAERGINIDFYYIGPKDRYIKTINSLNIKTYPIMCGKIRRYFSVSNLIDIPKAIIGLIQAFFRMFLIMPDAVFSKGGPGALQIVIAGWFYRIPVLIHESDSVPGLTNLLSAPFSKKINVGFKRAIKYFNPNKVSWVGNPIREELIKTKISQAQAKINLGFDNNMPLIFIIGGSLGSQRINNFVILALKELLQIAQVLHQTGVSNFDDVRRLSRAMLTEIPLSTELNSRYKPIDYLDINGIKTALSAADLVISRPGAGAISEIASFGKPSIMIPIRESANDHQRINAYEFAKSGAAVVIEEGNLSKSIFLNQVKNILGNADLRRKMSDASSKFFKPGAAEIIASELINLGTD